MPYVCGECKNLNARLKPDTEVRRRGYVIAGECETCGNHAFSYSSSGKYAWAPPKKSNRLAWRRIKKGILLWDRRRIARIKNRSGGNTVLGREATYGRVPGYWGGR